MIFKNQSSSTGRGVYVFAYDTSANAAKSGDAANITATISKDGGSTSAVSDTNPTEIASGVYWFDLTQSEVNCNAGVVIPSSSTANVELDVVAFTTEQELVDLIWDEVLTGATHNVNNSSGKRLRQIEAAFVLHSGTAQAGASNTITLDTGAVATDDFYNHTKVIITEGTGIEQERIIVDYVGSTKVATVAPPWVTQPDNTSVFEVEPGMCHAETGWGTIKVGVAAAATSTSITLASGASAVDDYYNGDLVHIDYGTGEGQVRYISDYNGTTKVATVSEAWTTTPDTTSEYIVEEGHPLIDAKTSDIPADVFNTILPGNHDTANSAGKLIQTAASNSGGSSTTCGGGLSGSRFKANLVKTYDMRREYAGQKMIHELAIVDKDGATEDWTGEEGFGKVVDETGATIFTFEPTLGNGTFTIDHLIPANVTPGRYYWRGGVTDSSADEGQVRFKGRITIHTY